MSAHRRTHRDRRRRGLGQNFLRPDLAASLVVEAEFRPDDLVVDIGAGNGAITLALARQGIEVVAIERDPVWAGQLRERVEAVGSIPVRVVEADILTFRFPSSRPFRVMSSLPFGATTDILHRLLDDPRLPLRRADLIVQWEVARKRAASPPSTLLSTTWSPWWEFRLAQRIPAREFRPVPKVDAGLLIVTRRALPILPPHMAGAFAKFVRANWPFDQARSREGSL